MLPLKATPYVRSDICEKEFPEMVYSCDRNFNFIPIDVLG